MPTAATRQAAWQANPPKIVPVGLVSRGVITTRMAGCASFAMKMTTYTAVV